MSLNRQQLMKALQASPSHNHQKLTLLEKVSVDNLQVDVQNQKKDDQQNQQSSQLSQKQMHSLNQQLILSEKISTQSVSIHVKKLMIDREDNVYKSFTLPNSIYLKGLLEKQATRNQKEESSSAVPQDSINLVIEKALLKRNQNVQKSLENGQLMIDRERRIYTKDQMHQLDEIDKERLIKIKEGVIKSKLDYMNEKLQEFENLDSKKPKRQLTQSLHLRDILKPENYALDSQKTQIAKTYAKHLAEQKRLQRLRSLQRQQQQKKKQEEELKIQKQFQKMKMAEKKQKRNKEQQARKVKKNQQLSINSQKQQKAKHFVDPYLSGPQLFEKKEKQYLDKIVKPMQEFRVEKLRKIRQARGKSDIQQINKHEEKYLKDKQEYQKKFMEKRQAQKRQLEKIKEIQSKYYRASSLQQILKRDSQKRNLNNSVLQIKKNQIHRVKAYQRLIKQEFSPEVDKSKQEQLKNRIQQIALKENKRLRKMFKVIDADSQKTQVQVYYEEIPEKDIVKQGNRNMEYSKRMIRKDSKIQPILSDSQYYELLKMQRKLSKKSNQTSFSKAEMSQQRAIWEARSKKIKQLANSPKQYDMVKAKIGKMDEDAQQKQRLIKIGGLSPEEHIQQKRILDQYYLSAIRGKMKLLQMQK